MSAPIRAPAAHDRAATTRPVEWAPLVAIAAALLIVACGGKGDTTAQAAPTRPAASGASAAGGGGPPVSIVTVAARQRDVPVLLNATGTVTPLNSVDVRAQVTSVVNKVHIREGQFVKAGELLFTLDARNDEANVAKARAQLARDQATYADANRQLQRARELLAQGFVSQGAVDTNQAQADAAAALVKADHAAVEAAQVSLSYSRVTAPSGGRVGAITVYPGTAVQANTTPLVTITQLDPISIAFNLPQRNLSDVLTALKNGDAPVKATLPDSGTVLTGQLKFVDNTVDLASGTVKVKAEFANADARLWPGAFVNVEMTVRTLQDAVVLPQAAIVRNARGTAVYAIEGGKAALRPVEVLLSQGDEAAVRGVKPGEKVALEGQQNLRPGAPVRERPPERSGTGSGGAADAASTPARGHGGSGANPNGPPAT